MSAPALDAAVAFARRHVDGANVVDEWGMDRDLVGIGQRLARPSTAFKRFQKGFWRWTLILVPVNLGRIAAVTSPLPRAASREKTSWRPSRAKRQS